MDELGGSRGKSHETIEWKATDFRRQRCLDTRSDLTHNKIPLLEIPAVYKMPRRLSVRQYGLEACHH